MLENRLVECEVSEVGLTYWHCPLEVKVSPEGQDFSVFARGSGCVRQTPPHFDHCLFQNVDGWLWVHRIEYWFGGL
jgi:hypothetical protein